MGILQRKTSKQFSGVQSNDGNIYATVLTEDVL